MSWLIGFWRRGEAEVRFFVVSADFAWRLLLRLLWCDEADFALSFESQIVSIIGKK